jgi:hypothetical protein
MQLSRERLLFIRLRTLAASIACLRAGKKLWKTVVESLRGELLIG